VHSFYASVAAPLFHLNPFSHPPPSLFTLPRPHYPRLPPAPFSSSTSRPVHISTLSSLSLLFLLSPPLVVPPPLLGPPSTSVILPGSLFPPFASLSPSALPGDSLFCLPTFPSAAPSQAYFALVLPLLLSWSAPCTSPLSLFWSPSAAPLSPSSLLLSPPCLAASLACQARHVQCIPPLSLALDPPLFLCRLLKHNCCLRHSFLFPPCSPIPGRLHGHCAPFLSAPPLLRAA